MPWTRDHLDWLVETGETVTTACGKVVPVLEFRYDVANEQVMSKWAEHFRNHYCLDVDLPILKSPDQSNSEYFLSVKFPNRSGAGPAIRAGDFSEILVADYLQYLCEYYVPRTRYDRKIIGNESTKGSDVVGFKQHGNSADSNGELIVYEVKAKLSENSSDNVLQTAINDSSKDEARLAESLNGIKQRLHDKGDVDGVQIVDRFQRNIDAPYQRKYGAAGIVTNTSYSPEVLAGSDTNGHVASGNLEMLVIKGELLMSLVHSLYERAANEA